MQERVTRKELLEMHVGQTRIFMLPSKGKVKSACTTAYQIGRQTDDDAEFKPTPDYGSCSVSIKRVR